MSEEFYFSVSFKMSSQEQMEDFETLHEYLELYDMNEARELLLNYELEKAQSLIDTLTYPHSSYSNKDDLLDMYVATYNENVDDVDLSLNPSRLKGTITAEGHDNDANSFCSAQILILIAMGATNINATANSTYWLSRWQSDENNKITLSFEVDEM